MMMMMYVYLEDMRQIASARRLTFLFSRIIQDDDNEDPEDNDEEEEEEFGDDDDDDVSRAFSLGKEAIQGEENISHRPSFWLRIRTTMKAGMMTM